MWMVRHMQRATLRSARCCARHKVVLGHRSVYSSFKAVHLDGDALTKSVQGSVSVHILRGWQYARCFIGGRDNRSGMYGARPRWGRRSDGRRRKGRRRDGRRREGRREGRRREGRRREGRRRDGRWRFRRRFATKYPREFVANICLRDAPAHAKSIQLRSHLACESR